MRLSPKPTAAQRRFQSLLGAESVLARAAITTITLGTKPLPNMPANINGTRLYSQLGRQNELASAEK